MFCPENVVCLLRLLHIFKYTSDENQADMGPYHLQYKLLKNVGRLKDQTTKVMTGGLRVNFHERMLPLSHTGKGIRGVFKKYADRCCHSLSF